MNLVEIFIEFMDSIYYQGYAKELAENYPDRYLWEYEQFKDEHA